MKKIAESLTAYLGKSEAVLREKVLKNSGEVKVYTDSVHAVGNAVVMMCRDDEKKYLLITAAGDRDLPAGFEGEKMVLDNKAVAVKGELTAANAAALRKYFPWTAPKSLRNVRTTVGCGDRLGLATTGHIRAARKVQISPVLAQQSMRELTMTGRTFRNVVDDACFLVFAEDYRDGYGADGDHLKTIKDIDTALAVGMPMITLDLSDVMNAAAGDWDAAAVDKAFAELPAGLRDLVDAEYAGKNFVLSDNVTVALDALTA